MTEAQAERAKSDKVTHPDQKISYTHGVGLTPLSGETIGQRFDATVARWPDNEALVVCHQGLRWRLQRAAAKGASPCRRVDRHRPEAR